MSDRKIFILDTSVLLYDKCSIHSFPSNDIIIPLVVLDELDRFKEKSGMLGENARYVNRYLDMLRSEGSLNEGITLKDNDQTIKVEKNKSDMIPHDLDERGGDNKIIGIAMFLKKQDEKTVILVTKDINLRVKCDSLGISSEDYYKDRVEINENEVYSGFKSIQLESSDIIDDFFANGKVAISDLDIEMFPNEFIIAKHQNQSMLGVARDEYIRPAICDIDGMVPINPRNKEQKFALDLLTRDDVDLVTLTGIAGSGKTFLTLMSAISGIQSDKYERIVLTRSLEPVGKPIGFLPGGINDKLDPWLGSITDNFRQHFKDITYFEMMRSKGKIEIAPLAFIRGRTFDNTFLIVDEAQNSTIHELKTIITRVGEGSKIVLLGDIEQIDTPYIDSLSNGLTIVIEKMKTEVCTGHVTLIKGERSKLATLASKLI